MFDHRFSYELAKMGKKPHFQTHPNLKAPNVVVLLGIPSGIPGPHGGAEACRLHPTASPCLQVSVLFSSENGLRSYGKTKQIER